MARPPGEVRLAVIAALRSGPCTLLEIVQRANVGYAAARATVQNALRGGELQICGQARRAHAKRWLAIYELVEVEEDVGGDEPDVSASCVQLGHALVAWSRPCCGVE